MDFLAGIIGQGLFLKDFVPVVQAHREKWFPGAPFQLCCGPNNQQQEHDRYTGMNYLRDVGLKPIFRSDANANDVRLAMIERLGGRMMDRDISAIAVNNDPERWLRVSREGAEPCPFLAEGFASGYTWDDHTVSVGHKEMRQPFDDGWAEHGMRCAELIELNFCAGKRTQQDRDRAKANQRKDPPEPRYRGEMDWSG